MSVDFSNLGSGNNGSINILNSSLSLQNFNESGVINNSISNSPYTSFTAIGTGLGVNISAVNPITVTNGEFLITNNTSGEISFSSGTLSVSLGNESGVHGNAASTILVQHQLHFYFHK